MGQLAASVPCDFHALGLTSCKCFAVLNLRDVRLVSLLFDMPYRQGLTLRFDTVHTFESYRNTIFS